MSETIINGAPMTLFQGIKDNSTRKLPAVAQAIPTHLPLFPLYTKKGPTTPQLVVGSSLTDTYHVDSFDYRKAWSNHATVGANIANAAANQLFVWRVKPDDAAPPATLRLSIDLLGMLLPVYQRNTDGTIKYDVNNNPMVVVGETVPGFKAKWVIGPVPTAQDGSSTFGAGAQGVGDQVDQTTQSVRFPIADFEVSSFGSWGNDTGLRIWAPTISSSIPVNDSMVSTVKSYPIRIACISRADASSTPTITSTLNGEQYIEVCLKPDAIDTTVDKVVSITDNFLPSWQSVNVPGQADVHGPFGRFHIYDANVKNVLDQVYAAEHTYFDAFSDFTGAADEKYNFNLFGGVSTQNIPYHTYQVVTGTPNSVRLSETSNLYAQGGTDGTMNDTAFATSVASMMTAFADKSSPYQDMAKYPLSAIWDTGYPLTTKYALINLIAIRKDTAVFLGTGVAGAAPLTSDQESSLALALKTRLQVFPESDYFGTHVVRGVVVSRTGKLLSSQYTDRLPLTIELLSKVCNYMGSSDGIWKSVYSFDSDPLNQVTMFSDINAIYTPAAVRNKDWKNGLMWPESYDIRSTYFPAFRTVYDDDTSVLNNIFTMMGCVELQKVGDRVRRKFSGNTEITKTQLIERVTRETIDQTKGRFDGRFIIIPEAFYTTADDARGYSYNLRIKIGANNAPTVMTLSIEANRLEDLQQ